MIRVSARNAGRDDATLDVLPTLWFRNTWSWGLDDSRPSIRLGDGALVAEHAALGRRVLSASGSPEALFCENETNTQRLWGTPNGTRYPKDGIHDHVVHGAATVDPQRCGTKAAFRYRLEVAAGQTATIELRLGEATGVPDDLEEIMSLRRREADEFYAQLTPAGASADEALVLRQALAGMLWSKQFYHYDIHRWLQGDPIGPPPPASRGHGRNSDWPHLNNMDVISMPDKWEYPWYASWDLAFHCVALAHVDPEFAKSQLILLCREWYMHPNGQLPAYEWSFGDVNPPVHAWAALRVYELADDQDYEFLERVLHTLLLGPFDRSSLPVSGVLEQSDGTAWMAMYCQKLLELALILAEHDPTYDDLATKFFEHFALIASALNEKGLWDEQDGFYYDVLHSDGAAIPLKARSAVGLLPLVAVTTLGPQTMARLPDFMARVEWFTTNRPEGREVVQHMESAEHAGWRMLSLVGEQRLRRMLATMLDPNEFLSDHGLRALSKYHAARPLHVEIGGVTSTLDYEPAESTSGLFGGNSNWRGPIWFPINYLLIEGLRVYHRYLGDSFLLECPTGSGIRMTLADVADELASRLIGIFCQRPDGTRPVFADYSLFQSDPAWNELIPFHEYFHGDTGAGLGASHQTGWTGLVADLIIRRRRG